MDPEKTARASNRPMVDDEDHGVAMVRREQFDARLAARLLFRKHNLAAFKISSGLSFCSGHFLEF